MLRKPITVNLKRSLKLKSAFASLSKFFTRASCGIWVTGLNSDGKIIGCFFFSIWVFFHEHSRVTGLQGMGEDISLTPHCHFHPLCSHLDISRTITTDSSPLHIASSWTRIGNLWFTSASRSPLSYAKVKNHNFCNWQFWTLHQALVFVF